MAIDQDLLFCSNTAVTGNQINGNVIDTVDADTRFGSGARPLVIDGRVTVTFTDSGDNSSAILYLHTSPYEAINSVTTNTAIGTIATNAAAGTRIGPFTLPPGLATERYWGVYSVVTNGNFSAGNITMWITPDVDDSRAFGVGWTGPTTS
jgi:hypothetical protein